MENKKMEILVVEDTEKHQEAARVLLKEYSTDIVSTFDEAMALLAGAGAIEKEKEYDVVLTDLFYTQGQGRMQSNRSLANEQMPFGFPLALIAVSRKVPYIGIVTDANHHDHPMAYAALDFVWGLSMNSLYYPTESGSKFEIFNTNKLDYAYKTLNNEIVTFPKTCFDESLRAEEKVVKEDGAVLVKNWKAALESLLK